MLFQSFHSYEHFEREISEKKCHHKYNSKAEITHQHHNYDHCFVCEFTFASFISPEIFSYRLHFAHTGIPYFYSFSETPTRFSGSSYSLRGPPSFIV